MSLRRPPSPSPEREVYAGIGREFVCYDCVEDYLSLPLPRVSCWRQVEPIPAPSRHGDCHVPAWNSVGQ